MAPVPIGTPYARGARGPDAYDCWGLVCAERPDIPVLARYTATDRAAMPRHIEEERLTGQWLRVWPPAPGDIVLMGTNRRLHHAGIAVAGGIKHTTDRTGALVQSLTALRQVYAHMEAYRWAG